jgi:hypothetical protein
MGLALTNKTIDKYFGFLTRLDNGSKKKLIIKLTESIETHDEKIDLRSLFGAWADDKDSDEIIKDIKSSRFDNQNLAEF